MAFQTPPEVLFRQCLRSGRSVVRLSPCSSTQPTRAYRAAVVTKLGQPITLQTMPAPAKLKPSEVLISTHAAGVNFADILSSKGEYQDKREPPFVPGSEIAGKIIDVGSDVQSFKKGDRVFAMASLGSGGFAELCVVSSQAVFPVPDNLSLVDAAGTVTSYGTAMLALTHKAKLQKGERVLVTAAAGATGLAAVDIAKNMFDCQVIGVSGGPRKCGFLREKGVDYTIDYNVEKIKERVKEITKGRGVNVAVDQVGGDSLVECVRSLGFEGRALTVGYASGKIPAVPANQLLIKSSSLLGVFWGNYSRSDPPVFFESIKNVTRGIKEGKLKPYVGQTFPLEQVNEAFQCISDRQNIGKVVVKIREEDAAPGL